MEYEFTELVPVQGASGWFGPYLPKEEEKVAKTYKVVVKDGDSTYDYDEKTGTYKYGTKDYVVESGTLGEALLTFLEYATDEYDDSKVTLTVSKAKKGKK